MPARRFAGRAVGCHRHPEFACGPDAAGDSVLASHGAANALRKQLETSGIGASPISFGSP